MKALIITEKYHPRPDQRDGGARVIDSLRHALEDQCDIMQFGGIKGGCAKFHYDYPNFLENRFERRLSNREFIGKKVREVSSSYTHLIFIHISMQFGLELFPVDEETFIWTFPMFLSPSYRASGEIVPEMYLEAEKGALAFSNAILTPSPFEKRQIHDVYGVEEEKIFMVPRGIDSSFISKNGRKFTSAPIFCSIGSIKPQKNTLKILDLFADLKGRFPSARLRLIGAIQDPQYGDEVQAKINQLSLNNQVELRGFVEPKELSKELIDCHFHLNSSRCETFGRSIFETLALGMPNIVLRGENAAEDFLRDLPYIAFIESEKEALSIIEGMSKHYETLSMMATEIGELYCDSFLANLLTATLFSGKSLAVCDFDGTLFHKNDQEKTERSLIAFNKFPVRAICSARPLSSLLLEIDRYQLKVDWIIAYGGALLADGLGNVKWKKSLTERDLIQLERNVSTTFNRDQQWIQAIVPKDMAPSIPFLRRETYLDKAYFTHWKASKLHAICQLLKEIKWKGAVAVYGDGVYDREMITYFDGKWVTTQSEMIGQQREINDA